MEGIKRYKSHIQDKINLKDIILKVVPFTEGKTDYTRNDFIIYAYHEDLRIGHVQCYFENDRLYCYEPLVEESYAKVGVVTKMCDHAESISGVRAFPDHLNPFKKAGKAPGRNLIQFWAKRGVI